jgi:hypothetical protein
MCLLWRQIGLDPILAFYRKSWFRNWELRLSMLNAIAWTVNVISEHHGQRQ